MSSKRILTRIGIVAVASLLAVAAAPKENAKTAKKPTLGVKTPGVQIPFASLKSEAEIKLEAAPSGAVFTTEGLVAAGNALQRIDGKKNQLGEKPIAGLNAACGGALNALGSLWTVDCGSKSLTKIDAKAGKITVTVPTGSGSAYPALAASTDSIWMLSADNATLSRVDPKENTVVADIRLAAGCNSLLFAENSLWVTCPGVDKVLRIDPRTNLVEKRVEVAGEPFGVAFGEGSIWVLAKKEGKVAQIDPKTNKVTATIELGIPNAAGTITFGEGSVWVSAPGFPISRIVPGTAKVAQQFAGEGGGLIYTGLGSVWLADAKAKTITRFDPKRIVATLAD